MASVGRVAFNRAYVSGDDGMIFDNIETLNTEELNNVVGGEDFITSGLKEYVPDSVAETVGPVVFNGAVFATRTAPNAVMNAAGQAANAVSNAASDAYNWVASWF